MAHDGNRTQAWHICSSCPVQLVGSLLSWLSAEGMDEGPSSSTFATHVDIANRSEYELSAILCMYRCHTNT